jgi:hypothetical protein
MFFSPLFKVGLLPCLRLATIGMKRNTLIEHKEATIVCDKSGLVSMSYNALLTTPEVITRFKYVVHAVIAKSTLTCTNCGKTNHLMETCHNRKKEVPFVPTTIMKSMKCAVGAKTQPIQSRKIHVHYPCIICFSIEHRSRECPKKIEVQTMFKTKLVSFNAIMTFKPPKTNNMPINVETVVTTRSRQLKH